MSRVANNTWWDPEWEASVSPLSLKKVACHIKMKRCQPECSHSPCLYCLMLLFFLCQRDPEGKGCPYTFFKNPTPSSLSSPSLTSTFLCLSQVWRIWRCVGLAELWYWWILKAGVDRLSSFSPATYRACSRRPLFPTRLSSQVSGVHALVNMFAPCGRLAMFSRSPPYENIRLKSLTPPWMII